MLQAFLSVMTLETDMFLMEGPGSCAYGIVMRSWLLEAFGGSHRRVPKMCWLNCYKDFHC